MGPIRDAEHGGMMDRWTRIARVARRGPARLLPLSLALALGLALVAAIAPRTASAHAYLVSSNPAANAVLKSAPTLVTLRFAEEVNPQGSGVVIYDATHKQVSTAPAQVSHSDLTTMTVPMAGDGDGFYLVEWHTVSAGDGDPDIGGFTFEVSASGAAASGGTTTTTPPASANGGSSGAPVLLTVVLVLVGLGAGGAGGYVVGRRAK
jgi:methionine-rich copper-binding protein CopC